MSAKLLAMQAMANEAAEESGIDMNEAVKGGGGGRLLPAGYAFGQLVEYIEFGNQPQEYQGVAKDPALEFTLGFALSGQGYSNDDGTPYISRTYNTALSRNEKSRAFKLFKALNWKNTAKSFAQMLGWFFLVKIEHKAKSKTDPTIVSRMSLEGFLPPLDPVTRNPYPIPSAPDDMFRMFLWEKPTKEAWDSLFIEGQYDGKSKNRIQETILAAMDYQGSPLQSLLGGAVAALPGAPALPGLPTAPAAPAAPAVAAAPLAVPAVAPVAPSVPAAVATPAPVTASAVPAVPVSPAAVASAPAAAPNVPVAPVTAAPIAPSPMVAPAPVAASTMTSPSSPAVPALPVLPA